MTSSDCIIKAFGGCRCADGECAEKPITSAPVVLPSWRTQAITCLFLGVVATFVSAAVMEAKLKHQDLDRQEVTSWKR
ncbi:hypothetical protein [Rhizobium phage RHEph18]|uniref:hypothetical protein n=1 Tax=Rhizobium TaxID=379 RepID=UPI0007E9B99B|nr:MULTISPECIES: hypothetical protein [Rhizobium]ANL02648.1 hypothetical protein AMJ99_CH01061 [Rhizobium esperanzae]ANM33500.1 hypothetical protein AMK04_CH01062 [Rhizobium sp. N871]QIG73732.1 hypothetical protein EVC05_040 [Rhizobium phage RHph_N2]QXV74450.1 hypothetical protein [Rhizobium phage RHEph18]